MPSQGAAAALGKFTVVFKHEFFGLSWSRDILVGIFTGLRAGRSGFRMPAGARHFSVL